MLVSGMEHHFPSKGTDPCLANGYGVLGRNRIAFAKK